MTYPSGRVIKNNYDAIGRLASVQNNSTSAYYASSAAYNTANQLTGFSYGNSVSANYGYSAQRLQLSSLSYSSGGNTLLSLSYGYTQNSGNNGEITSITDNVDSGRSATYAYDSLHRLSTASTSGSTNFPAWGLSWTYDRYGNRTQQSVTSGSGPSNSVTVSTSTNRVTSMGSSNFTYDSNGNLTQDDLYKYKYDAENRLVEMDQPSGTTIATYGYDGHSMRVTKIWGAGRTYFIYAGSQLICEFEDAASNTYSSGTTPASISDTGAIFLYQHQDHLSTRLTTDASGSLANQQAHYPYGESWYDSGDTSPSVERKFTAYFRDDESASAQNHYAIARENMVRIARFNRPDPVRGGILNPQRLNRYAYVMNAPTVRRDPRGLAVEFGGDQDGFGGVDSLSGGLDSLENGGDPYGGSGDPGIICQKCHQMCELQHEYCDTVCLFGTNNPFQGPFAGGWFTKPCLWACNKLANVCHRFCDTFNCHDRPVGPPIPLTAGGPIYGVGTTNGTSIKYPSSPKVGGGGKPKLWIDDAFSQGFAYGALSNIDPFLPYMD